ncbi:hypothetical protein [Vulcanisaeta distributa]|uniref:Uncharacterized protein n=1 Tax=Vulcanisaeta distributa (strain DSM 14429 / JCM 11212 / NBRC 100878 / IC-017) TaxID=572478 RepID=E1QPY8_VULDI|nr:hypothetical protein [Vulcanisaeta distributa]ADN51548.1 hypothetical protein Vdis_2180 [Vulcanisaeta distributa DSM 14429]
MSNEGIALLIMYVFIVFTVILPLTAILVSTRLGYFGIPSLHTIVSEYVSTMAYLVPLLIVGALLIYRYASPLAKVILSDVVRVYESHGVLDVFTRKRLLQLYLLLLIPALISYLINVGVIRIVGPNYITLYTTPFIGSFNLTTMIIGTVNLILSTWLIISVSYLQLRIAVKRIVNRLGSAIGGTVGIAASTGTAAFVGSACGLGACTMPISSVSPMAVVMMGLFDVNALELVRYSLVILLFLTLITVVLLLIVHRGIIKGS